MSQAPYRRMIAKSERLLAHYRAENKRLRILADHDPLTGLYNRNGFIREAERFLDELRAERLSGHDTRTPIVTAFSLLFIDVDDLKTVNDICGHKKGDVYLSCVAQALKANVRDIDLVGRWGGDEFVVGLVNVGEDDAYDIAHKLKERVQAIVFESKRLPQFTCSASFGIASAFRSSAALAVCDLHILADRADRAMYEAKRNRGKGTVASFREIQCHSYN